MRGVATLDLRPGEYELTPAADMRDVTGTLSELVSGGNREFHLFDVERGDGRTVLEVVRRVVPRDEGGLITRTDEDYLFRSPAGEPRLVLEHSGLPPSYTLRAADGGETLATWSKSLYVLGRWKLADPGGEVHATVKRVRSLGNLLSFSRYGTYAVVGTDGTELARFDHVRADGGLVGKMFSKLEITIESSSLPPEVLLGLGYGVFKQAQKSRSSSGGGGGD